MTKWTASLAIALSLLSPAIRAFPPQNPDAEKKPESAEEKRSEPQKEKPFDEVIRAPSQSRDCSRSTALTKKCFSKFSPINWTKCTSSLSPVNPASARAAWRRSNNASRPSNSSACVARPRELLQGDLPGGRSAIPRANPETSTSIRWLRSPPAPDAAMRNRIPAPPRLRA
jgi:hypothetical protein